MDIKKALQPIKVWSLEEFGEFEGQSLQERTGPNPWKYLYRKGDIVLCENGHEVCEISRDFRPGEPMFSALYTNFREGQKLITDVTQVGAPACHCGGVIMRVIQGSNFQDWVTNIKGKGWR